MKAPVSIGVISYAHLHSPRYTAAIAAHPQAHLAGIAHLDYNEQAAQQEAAQYSVPYFASWEALLEQPGLDAVYLGSLPTRHLELAAAAAARGLHVLCDKPIATGLEQAREIIRVTRQAGVNLMVPFNPRFQLPLIRLKEALDQGQAGELISIYAIKYGRLPTRAIGPQRAEWFLDADQAGGGGFMDIGIHAVDALRWLAGSEARRVYAQVGNLIHPDLGNEDLGLMTVEFDNGVSGVLSAGWANPDGYPTWLDVRFEVLAERQAFVIKSPYHDFAVYNSAKMERRYWFRRDIDGLVDEFIQSIRQDRPPAITGEDGLAALEIVLAAYHSTQTGQVVELGRAAHPA